MLFSESPGGHKTKDVYWIAWRASDKRCLLDSLEDIRQKMFTG
jgi:hypothetical protein